MSFNIKYLNMWEVKSMYDTARNYKIQCATLYYVDVIIPTIWIYLYIWYGWQTLPPVLKPLWKNT